MVFINFNDLIEIHWDDDAFAEGDDKTNDNRTSTEDKEMQVLQRYMEQFERIMQGIVSTYRNDERIAAEALLCTKEDKKHDVQKILEEQNDFDCCGG